MVCRMGVIVRGGGEGGAGVNSSSNSAEMLIVGREFALSKLLKVVVKRGRSSDGAHKSFAIL